MMFQMQGSDARTTRFGWTVGVSVGRYLCGCDVSCRNCIAENRTCGEALQSKEQRVRGKKRRDRMSSTWRVRPDNCSPARVGICRRVLKGCFAKCTRHAGNLTCKIFYDFDERCRYAKLKVSKCAWS